MKRLLAENQLVAILAAIVYGSISREYDGSTAARYAVDEAERILEESRKRMQKKLNAKGEK